VAALAAHRLSRRFARPRRRERERRRRFYRRAGSFAPLVGTQTDAGTFVVRTRDKFGEGLFAKRSRVELITLARAAQVLASVGVPIGGTDIVDVGAHVGTTTVAALRVQGFANAIAIEPNPEMRRLLAANLALNGLEDVTTVLPFALGEHDDRAALLVQPGSTGASRVVAEQTVDADVRVSVTTLDTLVEQGAIDPETIGLVWIDAQGNEGGVLRSASSLLDRGIPVVTAVRPQKLAAQGHTSFLVDAIREFCTHLVDLREPNLQPRWTPSIRPAASIEALATAAGSRETDVLAFRRAE
jgi:FkbM family methyltransferase